jgi:membrane-associated phospholipid phosphatase
MIRSVYDLTTKIASSQKLWRIVLAFLLFIVPVFLFAAIADEVSEHETQNIDMYLLLTINHHATPLLNQIVLITTEFGGVLFVTAATVAITAYLVKKRRWVAVTQLVAGVGGAGLINFLLKITFERDRPNLWQHIVSETSYSFPSGHAMLSSALALSIVVLLWHTKWRWVSIAIAAVYILVIGFTRLYLGVHYPTDVIAGWCVSLAWVVIVAIVLGGISVFYKKIFIDKSSLLVTSAKPQQVMGRNSRIICEDVSISNN